MNEVIITILIAFGTGIAGSFGGWFFGRKKQMIETIDLSADTWQKVVNNLEKQVEKLLEKVEKRSEENFALRDEVEQLRTEILTLQKVSKRVEVQNKKIEKYEKLLTANSIVY